MNAIINKSLKEFEKLAASGIVGDLLTLGFAGKLVSKAAQQIKGFKEAKKAGATLKEMLNADALPLGKQWKFKPLSKTNRKFEISAKNISSPISTKDPYEYHIDRQQDLAGTLAMPFGAGLAAYGISKKTQK
jgi:hypothetical protein